MSSTSSNPRVSGRWRGYLAMIASMIIAGALLAACGDDDDGGGDSGASSDEPIGIAGLEVSEAEGGPDFTKGMQIATEEINADGGVDGRMIDLQIIKTGGTPEGAASAYREAAADDGIVGTFLGAGGALAIREQSEREQLAIIGANGNDDTDRPVTRYVFLNSPASDLSTSALVYEDEQLDLEGKSVAVLHYESDFSQQVEEAITARCEDLGCEVVDTQEASATDSANALTPQLTNMQNSGADVYYIESLNPNALITAQQLGMDDKPIIAEQWLTIPAVAEATGKASEGVVFGGHKCRAPEIIAEDDPQKQWCDDYIARFEEMFPKQPFALFSIYGYDAVMTYADAARRLIEDGEEVNRDSIVDAMEEFDGELRTSHGLIETSGDDHRLTGEFPEAYLNMTIEAGKGGPEYVLAPDADPAGATP